MNACSEDIKDMLVAESALALEFGTTLFIGREPAEPSNVVTIFDTIGANPELTLDALSFERPSIQIRVRNSSYTSGWEFIQSITNALHGRAQETWNGTLYSIIYVSSGPAMLNWDQNNRVHIIVNFNIQRR